MAVRVRRTGLDDLTKCQLGQRGGQRGGEHIAAVFETHAGQAGSPFSPETAILADPGAATGAGDLRRDGAELRPLISSSLLIHAYQPDQALLARSSSV
jgi:hypothetical protein